MVGDGPIMLGRRNYVQLKGGKQLRWPVIGRLRLNCKTEHHFSTLQPTNGVMKITLFRQSYRLYKKRHALHIMRITTYYLLDLGGYLPIRHLHKMASTFMKKPKNQVRKRRKM